MKRIILLTALFFISICNNNFPDPQMLGELKFEVINPYSGKFNLSVTTLDYSWGWDKQNSSIKLVSSYSRNLNNLPNYSFDAPNDINAGIDSMVWGLMKFTIVSIADAQGRGGFTRTFTIDLRDEYWAHNQSSYPGSDTHIQIDQTNRKVYIIYAGNGSYGEVTNNVALEIWNIWESSVSPKQESFTVPITMKNRVEQENFNFGYLYANYAEVNSGSNGYFPHLLEKIASVGTPDYVEPNKKDYNFKWSYSENNISPTGVNNLYSNEFNFSIQYDNDTKSITRNFRTVYPLTIKNNLGEVGGISAGSVLFKDPTTTNTLELKDATGINGFYKDNAFKDLHIDLPPLTNQQYSIKAINSFSYNGRNYYWYSGDFNPTTQTDFLITGATAKTANYKGTHISNQTNAIAGNGQKKLLKTSDNHLHQVYESLNRV